mmetsp:Transcript_95959/g.214939  ORF Transcript_95959/g.214939 Transcript_95959/m.214939 type:complete len:347 (+) Transcript_95959:19-1059(+)
MPRERRRPPTLLPVRPLVPARPLLPAQRPLVVARASLQSARPAKQACLSRTTASSMARWRVVRAPSIALQAWITGSLVGPTSRSCGAARTSRRAVQALTAPRLVACRVQARRRASASRSWTTVSTPPSASRSRTQERSVSLAWTTVTRATTASWVMVHMGPSVGAGHRRPGSPGEVAPSPALSSAPQAFSTRRSRLSPRGSTACSPPQPRRQPPRLPPLRPGSTRRNLPRPPQWPPRRTPRRAPRRALRRTPRRAPRRTPRRAPRQTPRRAPRRTPRRAAPRIREQVRAAQRRAHPPPRAPRHRACPSKADVPSRAGSEGSAGQRWQAVRGRPCSYKECDRRPCDW